MMYLQFTSPIGTEDTSIADFEISKPLMYIEQVSHTYGYTMGAYAIQVLLMKKSSASN